jgi:hypothetical protein
MKTVEIKIYKFNELPEETKEKVLDDFRFINVDYDEWYQDDGLLELSEEEMKQSKIKLSKNWFKKNQNIPKEYPAYTGLFKWQKLYFSFDKDNYIQFEGLEVIDQNIFRKFLKIPKKLFHNCIWYFYNNSNYKNATTELIIESDKENGDDFTDKEKIIIDRAQSIMNNKIQNALLDIEDNYNYLISEESIINTIEANDYDFTADGKLF